MAPFRNMRTLVGYLRSNMARDNDNVIVIEGYEGSGKSNCGLWITRLLDPTFDPQHQTIFNHEQWTAAIKRFHRSKNPVFMFDEGGNLAFNRDWNTSENKSLTKILMQARILNSTMIFCIPDHRWLDKYLREHRCKILIRMERRTEATIHWRIKNWHTGAVRYEGVFRRKDIPNLRVVLPAIWNRYDFNKRRSVHTEIGKLILGAGNQDSLPTEGRKITQPRKSRKDSSSSRDGVRAKATP